MIDDVETPTHGDQPEGPVPPEAPGSGWGGRGGDEDASATNGRDRSRDGDGASSANRWGGGRDRGRVGRGTRRGRWWWRGRRPRRTGKPRVRKLRLLLILLGLSVLAVISTVFGMMMAVASDLPQIENRAQYQKAANTFLYDDQGHPIGIFAPPNDAVLDQFDQVSPWMRRAIVSVEDKR